ncbi:LOW QUALITY PROTEIN: microcephalin-like [Dama dama]
MPSAVGGWAVIRPGPGSQDSPVSDADHALLSDDRTAPVMSGGARLTQDPVLPGRTGLLTQVCAEDNDVALSALHPVQLWPPVRGSEVGREGAEESTWVRPAGTHGTCIFGSLCWEDALHLAQLGFVASNGQLETWPLSALGLPTPRVPERGSPVAKLPLIHLSPEHDGGPVLKDVVAYVEVWSANGRNKTFSSQLVDMGAKVSKTFNKQVTHVVFKDGYQSTWEKAQKRGVKLVSVLWGKRKCMQPKDFIPKTPENDKRLQKKFEKMAKELQQQKTTLGTNVPVLLFESNGSLVHSPTGKVYRGHHSAMKKRLQEMKEKRENLSPTSSQMIEQSDDNTVNSLREASLNLSHDTLCSVNSSAGGLPMSADDSCGGSASGTRERKRGEFITERESDLCAASPVLQTGRGGPSAAPSPLGLWTPPRSTRSPPKAETPQQSRAAGGVVTPVSKPSRPAVQGLSDGKKRLSPVSSAAKGRPEGRVQAMGSSVKRRKTPENWPASEEGRKRRRSLRPRPAACLRLWEAESGLCSVWRPAVKSLALEESSYDDYFSPDNLKERVSEGLLGEQLPSSPSPLQGQRSLSKTERTSLLDRADLSLIGRGPKPAVGTCSTAKPGPCLERPALPGADAGLGGGTSGGMPAADGTPGPCAQAEAQGGGDARPAGGDAPHAPSELVPRTGPQGEPSPLKGSREERKECTDTQSMKKEGTPPETTESAEAHSEGELNAVGDCAEEGSMEREAPAQGSRESM